MNRTGVHVRMLKHVCVGTEQVLGRVGMPGCSRPVAPWGLGGSCVNRHSPYGIPEIRNRRTVTRAGISLMSVIPHKHRPIIGCALEEVYLTPLLDGFIASVGGRSFHNGKPALRNTAKGRGYFSICVRGSRSRVQGSGSRSERHLLPGYSHTGRCSELSLLPPSPQRKPAESSDASGKRQYGRRFGNRDRYFQSCAIVEEILTASHIESTDLPTSDGVRIHRT